MDSVYDAAVAHAEKLKTELETLQNFLNLHDHFRDHFGLTPPAAPAPTPSEAALSEAEAPIADQAEATHEIHVQEPAAEVEDAVEANAPEAEALEVEASELEASASASESSEPTSSESASSEHDESLLAEPQVEASSSSKAAVTEEQPLVIQASEGVLIAASPEAAANEPLGPEATLQTVAEKLAATITASHPAVTGYTV